LTSYLGQQSTLSIDYLVYPFN